MSDKPILKNPETIEGECDVLDDRRELAGRVVASLRATKYQQKTLGEPKQMLIGGYQGTLRHVSGTLAPRRTYWLQLPDGRRRLGFSVEQPLTSGSVAMNTTGPLFEPNEGE